jgi:hypothetical protein
MTGVSGLSSGFSFFLALVILLVVLAVFYACSGKTTVHENGHDRTVRGFRFIVWGQDNRVSTSKVQLLLWTLSLAYALLVIALHDATFPTSTLDTRYLLLLGFPAGAVASAQVITATKTQNKTIAKVAAPLTKLSIGQSVQEIVSDDNGNIDLGDLQYFLFNLVALVSFFVLFFRQPTDLPMLSNTLVGLTSASATAYVAKKAATTAPMAITAVSPQKGPLASSITIFGSNLCGPGFKNTDVTTFPLVTVGGLAATINAGGYADDKLKVTVPVAGLAAGAAAVQVVNDAGQTVVVQNAFEVTA